MTFPSEVSHKALARLISSQFNCIKRLGLHRSPAPARIRRFFQIRQKSGSGQNFAGAGCYCQMLKMRTSNANSIFHTKILDVSHRNLFCLHSTDV